MNQKFLPYGGKAHIFVKSFIAKNAVLNHRQHQSSPV